jgi:chitin disaccharide deacetylase
VLIVNADDMGASPSTTDPVIECFDEGVISSATAMVWMSDSARAAELAGDRGLPLGLHLNLTLPFADEQAPDDVRQRQLSLTQAFNGGDSASQRSARPADGVIEAAVQDQLDRFRTQFGEPTHIDGHHHVHLNPRVLEHLPRSLPIRPPLAGAANPGFGQRWLLRRFSTPATCIPFEHVHPAIGGSQRATLGRAVDTTIEVMAHPADPRQRNALLSRTWREMLAGFQICSYRELAVHRSGGSPRRSGSA